MPLERLAGNLPFQGLRRPQALPGGGMTVGFRETGTRGCARGSKKAFASSFERSGMVFNTQKMQHTTGRTPFTGGGAGDAGDGVFGAY